MFAITSNAVQLRIPTELNKAERPELKHACPRPWHSKVVTYSTGGSSSDVRTAEPDLIFVATITIAADLLYSII